MPDEDEDASTTAAETRSAPGELALDATSSSTLATETAAQRLEENASRSGGKFKTGHHRGAAGFTSGPPWPTPKKEKPWQSVKELQRQQQAIEFIEQEMTVMAQETQLGIGKYRPRWLQRFANRRWMLFWMCWFCMVQGLLINGLVPSSLATIERRFALSTSTIGRIVQFYDFGYVLFCIPVSYFGGRHSKPLVLGLGLVLMALGSAIFTTPHSMSEAYTSTYNADDNGFSKCERNKPGGENSLGFLNASPSVLSGASFEALKSCPSPENQAGTFRYVFLFCLAHFLHGIGATPLFTIGVSYIDENVGPALSSLYLGIFYAFAIFGPAIGFLASSTFLRYHTDFLQSEHHGTIINLDESDPKWVGAWWIGFELACVLALLAVFPILSLSKVLPESLKWHRNRLRVETFTGNKKRTPECCGMPSTSKTAAITGPLLPDDEKTAPVNVGLAESMPALTTNKGPILYHIWLDVRHIPIAIYRILSNGSYMLITMAMAVDGFIVAGASTFMSKYLERQFGVAPSKANLLIGCIMVPMAGVGTMFSGFIVQHYRLNCVKTLKFCIGLLMIALVLSPMYLIYCHHDPLAGIEVHYPPDQISSRAFENATTEPRLHSTCNTQCDCVQSEYHPICAELHTGQQIAYYSPCYAGCLEQYEPTRKYYHNCSCVPAKIKQVKNGYCESKCTGLFGFLILFAPFCFCTFAVGVPLISVVLRTVDYAERSFALGIQWILVRVIGTIPAPVLFGWMFDVSCVRRHLDPCSGQDGSCMLYYNKLLADLFLTFSVVGQSIALVLLVLTLIFFAGQLHDDSLPHAIAEEANLSQILAPESRPLNESEDPLQVST